MLTYAKPFLPPSLSAKFAQRLERKAADDDFCRECWLRHCLTDPRVSFSQLERAASYSQKISNPIREALLSKRIYRDHQCRESAARWAIALYCSGQDEKLVEVAASVADDQSLTHLILGLQAFVVEQFAQAWSYWSQAFGIALDGRWFLLHVEAGVRATKQGVTPRIQDTWESTIPNQVLAHARMLEAALLERPPQFGILRIPEIVQAMHAISLQRPLNLLASQLTRFSEHYPQHASVVALREHCAQFGQSADRQYEWRKPISTVNRGSKTVVIVFCGLAQKVGVPVSVFDAMLGELGLSAIYLRDFSRRLFLAGLGETEEKRVAETLRHEMQELGAQHSIAVGSSGGSFYAALAAARLKSKAVIMLAGPSNLSKRYQARVGNPALRKTLKLDARTYCRDLKSLLTRESHQPHIYYFYGDRDQRDIAHAANLMPLPYATVHQLSDHPQHVPTARLIQDNTLQTLLSKLSV